LHNRCILYLDCEVSVCTDDQSNLKGIFFLDEDMKSFIIPTQKLYFLVPLTNL